MRRKTSSNHYINNEFPTQKQFQQNYSKLVQKINNTISRLTAEQKHTSILALPGITITEMDSIIKSTGPKLAITLRKFISTHRLQKLDKRNVICSLDIKNGKPIHVESQYEWPYKWNKKIVTYAILKGTQDANSKDILRKATGLAFSTWGAEIPLKFARVHSSNNPDIVIKFENDPYADSYLRDKPTVLAYAYYPKTSKQGIIVFNDYRYHWGKKDRYSRGQHVWNINHVLCHEIGHSIGLSHDTTSKSPDMLDPYYNGDTFDLSNNDIARITKKYGKRIYKNQTLHTRLKRYISYRKRNLR